MGHACFRLAAGLLGGVVTLSIAHRRHIPRLAVKMSAPHSPSPAMPMAIRWKASGWRAERARTNLRPDRASLPGRDRTQEPDQGIAEQRGVLVGEDYWQLPKIALPKRPASEQLWFACVPL